jgi:multicomponent Na+:H+ antiporter subunit F
MMFAAAAAGLLVALALVLVRAFLGPTVFDRAQAANTVGTLAVLLLSVMGFLSGRPDFLDLAIVYGLLNLVGTIAVLKYFQYGALGEAGDASRSSGS